MTDYLFFPLDFIIGTLIPFLVLITIVIFFHELGHYLVARWNNVRIETFSIGFGTRLYHFFDRHGTEWRVCLFPLGGYVKFWGDADVSSGIPNAESLRSMTPDERAVSFEHKALWRKSLIVAAGPLANFLLAIAIYTFVFMVQDDRRQLPVVGGVIEGSAASESGIEAGDYIVSVNGDTITSFNDIREAMLLSSGGSALEIVVRRGSDEFLVEAAPRLTEVTDAFGNTYELPQLGLESDPDSIEVTRLNFLEALYKATDFTWFMIKATLNFVWELIAGRQNVDSLRGPIGIGEMASDFATLGLIAFFSLCAAISVAIGLVNLFPIPVLDGGHLVFYGIEAILRRPLSVRFRRWALKGGMACILALFVFATGNDLFRILVN